VGTSDVKTADHFGRVKEQTLFVATRLGDAKVSPRSRGKI